MRTYNEDALINKFVSIGVPKAEAKTLAREFIGVLKDAARLQERTHALTARMSGLRLRELASKNKTAV